MSVISYMATLNSRLYLIPIEGHAEVGLRVNRLLEIDVESLNLLERVYFAGSSGGAAEVGGGI